MGRAGLEPATLGLKKKPSKTSAMLGLSGFKGHLGAWPLVGFGWFRWVVLPRCCPRRAGPVPRYGMGRQGLGHDRFLVVPG